MKTNRVNYSKRPDNLLALYYLNNLPEDFDNKQYTDYIPLPLDAAEEEAPVTASPVEEQTTYIYENKEEMAAVKVEEVKIVPKTEAPSNEHNKHSKHAAKYPLPHKSKTNYVNYSKKEYSLADYSHGSKLLGESQDAPAKAEEHTKYAPYQYVKPVKEEKIESKPENDYDGWKVHTEPIEAESIEEEELPIEGVKTTIMTEGVFTSTNIAPVNVTPIYEEDEAAAPAQEEPSEQPEAAEAVMPDDKKKKIEDTYKGITSAKALEKIYAAFARKL